MSNYKKIKFNNSLKLNSINTIDNTDNYYFYKAKSLDKKFYINTDQISRIDQIDSTKKNIIKIDNPSLIETIPESEYHDILSRILIRSELRPKILFLKLKSRYDRSGALHTMTYLQDQLRLICPSYEVISLEFGNLDELLNCFNGIDPYSIAHLNILTHGTRTGIQVGDTDLEINTDNFRRFVDKIKPLLMNNASIFLCACLTGEHEDLGRYNLRRSQISVKNCQMQNFANLLSINLPNNPILATRNTQIARELEVLSVSDLESTCSPLDNTNPLYLTYISIYQPVFIFSQTDNNRCEILEKYL